MTTVYATVAALCLLSGLVLPRLKIIRSLQRRIYWSCAIVSAMFGFLCGYPDLREGFVTAGALLAAMATIAFRFTPYVKIRGKIYAGSESDRRADDD